MDQAGSRAASLPLITILINRIGIMSQEGEGAQTLDFAVERYKHGRCPGCGKRFGEPRGLEYRNKSSDFYCHTCRRHWPIELNIESLRDELPLLESPQSGMPLISVPGLSTHQKESARRPVVDRFGRFLKRMVARH